MSYFKFTARNTQPIGLDIGHSSIKMVQLCADADRIKVIAAQKEYIAHELDGSIEQRNKFIVSAIKKMLSGSDFKGKDVVSVLPNDKMKITSLRIADDDIEQIDQTLKKEAVQRFGLNPDYDAVRYMIAGNVRQGDEIKNELILFGAGDDVIKEHINMLEEAGLKSIGIDAVACSLFRNFERQMRRLEDRERTVIFADIGHCSTTVVFGRAGELCFIKQIPIGAEQFNIEVAQKLNISLQEAEALRIKLQTELVDDSQPLQNTHGFDRSTRQIMIDAISGVSEQLTREISLCLRYYTVTFRGKRIERAVITGGGAYENIFIDILKRRLSLEIEVAEPFRGFKLTDNIIENDTRGLFCEWAVAVGLGLKGLEPPETNSQKRIHSISVGAQ
jgi:type IV pilus assembly protein PilM